MMSTGTIIGIIVMVIGVCLLLGLVSYYLWSLTGSKHGAAKKVHTKSGKGSSSRSSKTKANNKITPKSSFNSRVAHTQLGYKTRKENNKVDLDELKKLVA